MEPKKNLFSLSFGSEELINLRIDINMNVVRKDEDGQVISRDGEREKMVAKIMETFNELTPELQESVIRYAESLKNKTSGNGQHTAT